MAEEEITGYLGAVSFEGLKIYLTEYMGGTGLFFSYKTSYEDGAEKYAYVEFVKAGLLPNGKVGYEKLFCDEQELDKGPFEVHTSLSRGLIEETPYSN